MAVTQQSGVWEKLIHEKTRCQKSHVHVLYIIQLAKSKKICLVGKKYRRGEIMKGT